MKVSKKLLLLMMGGWAATIVFLFWSQSYSQHRIEVLQQYLYDTQKMYEACHDSKQKLVRCLTDNEHTYSSTQCFENWAQ